jgi:DNA polymerase-1
MSKILLCDGHNLAFRAFYGIRELTRSDGFPTNMVHGWLRSFWKMEDDLTPRSIQVFFDKDGATRREKILPSYKENRGLPPEGFSEQLEWVKKLTDALGYGRSEKSGLEADDLIASAVNLYTSKNDDVLIVSADKDLAQLISPGVEQLLPPPTANPRLGWRMLDEKGVMEKFGVPPQSILDYLAIIGDQADNIPGLAGVGPKTASKWLNEYGHLENLILNAGRLTPKRFCSIVYEKRDELRRNLELVRLESDIELDLSDNSEPDLVEMKEIFAELEMKKSWEEAQKRYNLT